jgi:hypothetical protein
MFSYSCYHPFQPWYCDVFGTHFSWVVFSDSRLIALIKLAWLPNCSRTIRSRNTLLLYCIRLPLLHLSCRFLKRRVSTIAIACLDNGLSSSRPGKRKSPNESPPTSSHPSIVELFYDWRSDRTIPPVDATVVYINTVVEAQRLSIEGNIVTVRQAAAHLLQRCVAGALLLLSAFETS